MCVWYNVYGHSGFLGGSCNNESGSADSLLAGEEWKKRERGEAAAFDRAAPQSASVHVHVIKRLTGQTAHHRGRSALSRKGRLDGVRGLGVRCDMRLSGLGRKAAATMLVHMPLSAVSEVRRRQARRCPCVALAVCISWCRYRFEVIGRITSYAFNTCAASATCHAESRPMFHSGVLLR